jgi:hypothetical protein
VTLAGRSSAEGVALSRRVFASPFAGAIWAMVSRCCFCTLIGRAAGRAAKLPETHVKTPQTTPQRVSEDTGLGTKYAVARVLGRIPATGDVIPISPTFCRRRRCDAQRLLYGVHRTQVPCELESSLSCWGLGMQAGSPPAREGRCSACGAGHSQSWEVAYVHDRGTSRHMALGTIETPRSFQRSGQKRVAQPLARAIRD